MRECQAVKPRDARNEGDSGVFSYARLARLVRQTKKIERLLIV